MTGKRGDNQLRTNLKNLAPRPATSEGWTGVQAHARRYRRNRRVRGLAAVAATGMLLLVLVGVGSLGDNHLGRGGSPEPLGWIRGVTANDVAGAWVGPRSAAGPTMTTPLVDARPQDVTPLLSALANAAEMNPGGLRQDQVVRDCLVVVLDLHDGRRIVAFFEGGYPADFASVFVARIEDGNFNVEETFWLYAPDLLQAAAAVALTTPERLVAQVRTDIQPEVYGLWSRNVETIPARPATLPPRFWEKPADFKGLLDGSGHWVLRDPAKIGRPLWIFGNEVDIRLQADRIVAAHDENRVVLLYDVTPDELGLIVGETGIGVTGVSRSDPTRSFLTFYGPNVADSESNSGIATFPAGADVYSVMSMQTVTVSSSVP